MAIMRKQTVSLFTLILTASVSFFSCGNFGNKNNDKLSFDSIQVNETVHLFNDTAKPACNLVINFAYVTNSTDNLLKDSLNAFFQSACFGEKYLNLSPQEAIEQYKKKYTTDYRADLEPMFKQDEQENRENTYAWYSYYKNIESHIQLFHKDLLVYHIYYHEYTGGAHGNYMSTFLNLDLKTLTPIHLRDLFVEDYKDPLTQLLWQQLIEENHVSTRQEIEDLGYGSTGELEPTENFYLTPKGITFYYNIYEIAPYVMGPTQITLPYESIQHLLNDTNGILKNLQ